VTKKQWLTVKLDEETVRYVYGRRIGEEPMGRAVKRLLGLPVETAQRRGLERILQSSPEDA
jgi:hypothetical protein